MMNKPLPKEIFVTWQDDEDQEDHDMDAHPSLEAAAQYASFGEPIKVGIYKLVRETTATSSVALD